MNSLKGVILASKREDDELSLIAGGRAHHALPVANRPLVLYGLRSLAQCGIEDVAIVVSDETSAAVRSVVREGIPGVRVTFLQHPGASTVVEALAAVREFLGGSPFALHLGDSLFTEPLAPLADEFRRLAPDALVVARRTSGETQPGVIDLDRRRLLRLAGQPAAPPSEHLLTGGYFFGPAVTELAERMAGETTTAGVLAALAAEGGTVETRTVDGSWKYSGSVDSVLEANQMVLDCIAADVGDVDLSSARIEGRVVVHPSAVLDRATVRGPAIIAAGAILIDTFVGPYTAVGENVCLDGAEVEYSIILAGAAIRHPGKRLEASLVGQDATVTREFNLPASLRLRVGRRAEISLS